MASFHFYIYGKFIKSVIDTILKALQANIPGGIVKWVFILGKSLAKCL